MQYVPAIGAMCLGVVVGWLVRYFIRRFEKFAPGVLSSVLTLMLGGVVVKFLSADKTVWWFYPIGLLLGFVIYQVIVMIEMAKGAANMGLVPNLKFGGKDDGRFVREKPEHDVDVNLG